MNGAGGPGPGVPFTPPEDAARAMSVFEDELLGLMMDAQTRIDELKARIPILEEEGAPLAMVRIKREELMKLQVRRNTLEDVIGIFQHI